jgi:hypothetical protein
MQGERQKCHTQQRSSARRSGWQSAPRERAAVLCSLAFSALSPPGPLSHSAANSALSSQPPCETRQKPARLGAVACGLLPFLALLLLCPPQSNPAKMKAVLALLCVALVGVSAGHVLKEEMNRTSPALRLCPPSEHHGSSAG